MELLTYILSCLGIMALLVFAIIALVFLVNYMRNDTDKGINIIRNIQDKVICNGVDLLNIEDELKDIRFKLNQITQLLSTIKSEDNRNNRNDQGN